MSRIQTVDEFSDALYELIKNGEIPKEHAADLIRWWAYDVCEMIELIIETSYSAKDKQKRLSALLEELKISKD